MSFYTVNWENGEALYAQTKRQPKPDITSFCAPSGYLPSENDLAMWFGMNRHTLRRMIGELVDVVLLKRRHGRGVAVLDSQIDYQIGAGPRCTENLIAAGVLAFNWILRKQTLPAIKGVAERLQILHGKVVLWIETFRLVDEHPMCVISNFSPAERFPDLLDRYEGGSLHAFLKYVYGCCLRWAESLVTGVLLQVDHAKCRGMPQNRPVLRGARALTQTSVMESRSNLPLPGSVQTGFNCASTHNCLVRQLKHQLERA